MWRALWLLILPAVAAADRHEPDNTRNAAAEAPPISHIVGQPAVDLTGLVAEAGGEDWFHLYADCCTEVGVQVRWRAGQGPLRLELFDAAGAPVLPGAAGVTVSTGGGFRRISVQGTGGHWYARVTSTRGSVSYDLRALAPVYVN